MLIHKTKAKTFRRNAEIGNGLFGIKPLEWFLCAIILAGCVTLHLTRFYYPLALPIEVGLSLISFATPISGMLYLSAAQVIPDALGSPLPSAQMALLGFFLWQLARGKVEAVFSSGRRLLITVAPFFVWNAGWAFLRGDRGWLAMVLVFAILTGCAAAALVQQSGRRLEACLAAFLAGQALAMCLFWILKLKLGEPVEAFDTEIYSSSLVEGARIGTARGNANVLGPPMALVLTGVIAFFFTRPLQFTRKGWIPGMAGLIGIAAVLPPLIGSGSRGALVSVVCGLLFLLFAGGISPKMLSSLPVVAVGVLLIFGVGWNKLGLNESWEEMGRRQEMQEEALGSGAGGKLVAGRSLEWTAALRGILDSPIIGGGYVEKLSYFGNEEFWLSHSTYLDAGLVGGLPGMVLFCWFVFKPILELWRRCRETKIGWLLAVYAVSIISIGSTSAMQMKAFWILWGMAAVCFLPAVARLKTRGHRAARRVERRGQGTAGGNWVPVVRSP